MCQYKLLNFLFVVPAPNHVNIVAGNNQTVGQSLTLECNITTVRGITSRMDFVWSSGSTKLKRTNNVNKSLTINNNDLYEDTFTIPLLSTTDDGRLIQCEITINTTPSVVAANNIILDVTGEFCFLLLVVANLHGTIDNFQPITIKMCIFLIRHVPKAGTYMALEITFVQQVGIWVPTPERINNTICKKHP